MNLREIRIGSLILDYSDFKNPLVREFYLDDFVSFYNGNYKFMSIPLTEEWLVKCGFVKDGEGDYCQGDFCFRWQFNALTLLLDTGYIKPPLIYVHQLQNLYFALTGEELTINL